ncbi:hypothetical protein TWF281_004015 [Arthrobotrys megalospora]
MEDLLTLHRKQLRDLQSVITQKKKSATKKTRRGVNDDCERLERELKEKQASEIAALEQELNLNASTEDNKKEENEPSEQVVADKSALETPPEDADDISTGLQETTLEDPTEPTNHERIQPPPSSSSSKKPNRAKARLARRAAQIEEITAQAQEEAASQPDLRAIEAERMKQLFEENGLIEIQIAPDGHCLYSAFAVGLEGAGIPLSDEEEAEAPSDGTKKRGYTFTRKAAGEYISSHPDDFIPFLDEGETLDVHVWKVKSTAEWGGHMELLALAKEYGVTVKVVQAQGVGVTAMNEDEGDKADVWLAYHRKGYGLGEHYNALRKK